MAMGITLRCTGCGRTIQAWSDGNPYYFDRNDRKRYAYHPDPNLALCVGHDADCLCLACGKEHKIDSDSLPGNCPSCGDRRLVDVCALSGQPCPSCEAGVFEDTGDYAIS